MSAPCHCVHCTPGGELCPRCHPESRDATVCVRLDGLADRIAERIAQVEAEASGQDLPFAVACYTGHAAALVDLLQSLAVQ
jgi:hypothetical protein